MTEETAPDVPGVALRGTLGRGSTATVYLGVDDATGHRVAVKVIDAARDRTRTSATGFTVDSDSLLRLFRAGRTTAGDTCLVLEFCPGGTLADQVSARGPFDLGEVACVLRGLADGLGELHARGLVHGDLSPSNVLFTGLGRPLLGDLDTVGRVGEPVPSEATEGYTDDAANVLDPLDDVYSLGAVGWFLLTGEAPGPESSRLPLPAMRPDTPAPLADLIVACLAPRSRRPGLADVVMRLESLPVAPEAVRLRPVVQVPDREVIITARKEHPAPVREAGQRLAAATRRARRLEERRIRRRDRGLAAAGFVTTMAVFGGVWSVTRPAATPAVATLQTGAATSAAAMPTDPAEALTELNRRRVLATTNRDTAALRGVDAPASTAMRHDATLIARLRRTGARPQGLRVTILWTTVRSTTATRSEILLSSVVESYRLVRSDGSLLRKVPQGAITTDVVTLTRASGEWRVLSVRDS